MINNENYFDLNNKGLSQSKIKDYLICPNYFYRKHISGELVKEFKKAFVIGDAVDDILTKSDSLNNYAVCENKRTTKAGKAEAKELLEAGKTVISRTDYDQIVNIADAFGKTDAYKEIDRTFVFQEIFQFPMDLGEHFNCLYGKPDAYRINEDGTCDLVDIKTTMSVDDKKYGFNFFSYGYDKQLFLYAYLIKCKHPLIKGFRYWHLVAEKSEPFTVKLFEIPHHVVDFCEKEVFDTIDKIKNDKTFAKYNPSFEEPKILGNWGGFGEEE